MSAAPPREYTPKRRAKMPPSDHTVLVRIRKEGNKYVAHPKRIPVLQGVANVVFVLENAPDDAQLLKIKLNEHKPRNPEDDNSNPFSFPSKYKVMLMMDDNTPGAHQGRHFDYELKVMEGDREFLVDPGIDNDPPPPG